MKKRPDITDNTKNNLKDAFWKLYEQKAVERITIKQITELAGYNRGTFYLYYKDVYDIFEQIEDEMLSYFDESFKLLPANIHKMKIQDLMKFVIELYEPHNKHMSVLLGENSSQRFENKLKEKIKGSINIFFKLNHDGKSLEAEYMIEFYVSGLLSVIKMWYDNEQDLPLEDFLHMMYGVMMK